MDTILCLKYDDWTFNPSYPSSLGKVLASLDTGIGISVAGFFIAAASIFLASIGIRKGTQNNDFSQLERRIRLCEEDRKQLHSELEGLRNANLWLTQQLAEKK